MTPRAPIWRVAEQDPAVSANLAASLGLSGVLARVLAARGLGSPAAATRFLAPRFERHAGGDLPGVGSATDLLRAARRAGRAITIYGDYDVDGVAATTILRGALDAYGCVGPAANRGEIGVFIPRRTVEGYGLSADAVRAIAAEGTELLVTVDCGISAHREIELANQLGMAVVVTDHHQPSQTLPPAAAVVNPWLAERSGVRADEPCGALVALDLAMGLVDDVAEHWLDLAALATVADIVPLVGRNRGLVSESLQRIPATTNPGLAELICASGLAGRALTARDLAFALAPRVNALGRMERNGGAMAAVRLFESCTREEAAPIAQAMDEANRERQAVEARLTGQSMAMLGADADGTIQLEQLPPALVVAGDGPDWSPGVVGIVASRLATRFWRPAAVVALDGEGSGRGSVRGVPGYNVYQALLDCSDVLDRFGGHTQAGGFSIAADRIKDFAVAFSSSIAGQGVAVRELAVDVEVALEAVDERLAADLSLLEPFGHGNPAVALASFGCEVLSARPIGAGKHLALTLRQNGAVREAVRFSPAEGEAAASLPGNRIDVVYAVEVNEWRGRRQLRLNIKEIREATRDSSTLG